MSMTQREQDLWEMISSAQSQQRNLLHILDLHPNLPEMHKKSLRDAVQFAKDIEYANFIYLQTVACMFGNEKGHVLNNIEDHYYQVRNGGG